MRPNRFAKQRAKQRKKAAFKKTLRALRRELLPDQLFSYQVQKRKLAKEYGYR